MKEKKTRRILLAALLAMALVPAAGMAYAAASDGIGLAKGDVLIKNTTTKLAPGVYEHEVVTNTAAGNDQKIDYLCEIDLQGTSTTKIVAGYGSSYSADSWELSPTTKQAAAYEQKTGETVVAAINADFFNMATGEPQGALVMDGRIAHNAKNRNYFAILKDGTAVIREGKVPLDDCQAAVGGDVILLKDGKIQDVASEYGNQDYSRTAIGIKPDGTVVTFVTHGRLYPVSCGRTYQEIAEMLQDAGCVSALALDGGGSSTYAARPEGSDGISVRNTPSDGAEREVSSSLLIVSTAKPTGEFDHAAITPNNDVYTPGSKVQFEAHGADSSGTAVDLPQDLTWALADESKDLGSIDASSGLFTAGEDEGTVTVQMLQGQTVVGSTSIDLAAPDQIYFSSEEVSLGFEAQSDLGLVVRSKGRDLHYNDGDIVWSMTNDKLGSFEGNIFTSSDGESLNGNVTATSRFNENVSGTIHVIVGMLPTLVWDFEDHVDEESGEVTAASEYYTGENGVLTHSNYGRGGKESIEIVSIDDDEPVRFGSHALKLNFDFTQCGAVTEGACVGTTDRMTVPGTPTGIGVWVYAPEGVGVEYQGAGSQAGFWLRGYVRDGAGNNMPYDFTFEPKSCPEGQQPGIYWEGWQYLEADLTSMSAPFSIQPGMTFRLMYVAGTNMGTKTAGSIYFDNLQFVYGTNIDDVDEPVVDSVQANGVELENGATLSTNVVTFDAMFHDVENKYTSGVDQSTIRMYVDGVNVVDNEAFSYVAEPDGTRNHLYDVRLQNGEHAVTVSLRDKFGNETTETRTFSIEADGLEGVPTMTVAPKENAAVLGETVSLEVRASDASSVQAAMVALKLGNQFKEYEVQFSDAYEGTTSYKKLTDTLTLDAQRKEGASADDGLIATVIVQVPSTLTDIASFSYAVKAGSYTVGDDLYTYSAPEQNLPVSAAYTVTADPIIVGSTGVISVVDANGEPAAGVTVKYVGDTEEDLGVTNDEGVLETDRFSSEAGKYVVYAVKDGRLSFRCTIGSYNAQGDESGAPYGIMNHVTADPSTEKSVSWISSPKVSGSQVLQYAKGDGEWQTVEATSHMRTFTKGGNTAAAVNNVRLSGLEPGVEYRYRVGSEAAWSDEMTFTTNTAKKGSSFFLLGDIQSEDLTNVNALMDQIKQKDYDFGIQTGDAVDDATSYEDWTDVATLFGVGNLADTDMLNVLGNHEYAGDANADTAAAMYDLPASGPGSHYSVTYGNTYVAVINYAGNSIQLADALQWLEEDAAKSKATWKILTIHQPAYYTNVVGGNAEVHAMLPPVAERCGIDFVFSGHDHSYARTEPLTAGEVDKAQGIVYYICGSSGEKSYTVTDNKDFHFAKLSSDYSGVFLSVNATNTTMTVDTYEVDGSLLDSYTKTKVDPCAAGHKPTHYADGSLRCSVCGDPIEGYTGFAVDDATGKSMYYLEGSYKTGWFTYVDQVLHFDKNGLQHEVTSEEMPTTCTKQGATTYTCECGATYTVKGQAASGHEYVQQDDGSFVCSVCGWKRIEVSECTVSIPYQNYTYNGSARKPYPSVTAPDGTQLKGGSVDYFVNWRNNTNVGYATAVVTAKSGYLVNLTDYRGDYGGKVEVTFKIRPPRATDLHVVDHDPYEVDLAWDGSEATEFYQVYCSADNGGTWKKLAETSETTYTASDLDPETTYQFKIRSYTTVNNEKFYALSYSDTVSAQTDKLPSADDYVMTLSNDVYTYTGADHKPEVKVFTAEGEELAVDEDYALAYDEDCKNAGIKHVVATVPTEYGDVELTKEYTVNTASLGACKATLANDSYVFTGGQKKPGVTVTTARGTKLANGKNYKVEYLDNKDAGTATVVVTGIGNYSGVLTEEFTIEPASIESCKAKLNFTKATYSGTAKRPGVTVTTAKGTKLANGKNYTVSYQNNTAPGTAKVTVVGTGNYKGTINMTFTIAKADLSACSVSLPYKTYYYTGKAREPQVTVKTAKGTRLAEGKNYEVTYKNNVKAGTATVVVTGIGNYQGKVSTTFVIKNR